MSRHFFQFKRSITANDGHDDAELAAADSTFKLPPIMGSNTRITSTSDSAICDNNIEENYSMCSDKSLFSTRTSFESNSHTFLRLPPLVHQTSISSCDSVDSCLSSPSRHTSFSTDCESSSMRSLSTKSSTSTHGDSFTVPTVRIQELERSHKFKRPHSPSERLFHHAHAGGANLLKQSLTPKLSADLSWAAENAMFLLEQDEQVVLAAEESDSD